MDTLKARISPLYNVSMEQNYTWAPQIYTSEKKKRKQKELPQNPPQYRHLLWGKQFDLLLLNPLWKTSDQTVCRNIPFNDFSAISRHKAGEEVCVSVSACSCMFMCVCACVSSALFRACPSLFLRNFWRFLSALMSMLLLDHASCAQPKAAFQYTFSNTTMDWWMHLKNNTHTNTILDHQALARVSLIIRKMKLTPQWGVILPRSE